MPSESDVEWCSTTVSMRDWRNAHLQCPCEAQLIPTKCPCGVQLMPCETCWVMFNYSVHARLKKCPSSVPMWGQAMASVGQCEARLWPVWAHVRPDYGQRGPMWGPTIASVGPCEARLWPAWAHVRPDYGQRGPMWGPTMASVGPCETQLWPVWAPWKAVIWKIPTEINQICSTTELN